MLLAVARNARHGLILSQEDKRRMCVQFFVAGLDQPEVCQSLAISERTWRDWTETAREARAAEQSATILDLHLRCETQDAIAKAVGITQQSVTNQIAAFTKSGDFADSGIFRNFDQEEMEESGRRIYDVWNFVSAKNEVRHFGNIPPGSLITCFISTLSHSMLSSIHLVVVARHSTNAMSAIAVVGSAI